MNLIETLFESGHTIAWDYISSFQFLPDALLGIGDFIRGILKTGYDEIREGVWASPSAVIAESACILPPCIIGANTEIRHSAFIRGNAVIGNNVVIGNSVEIKNAIISDCSEVPHFNYVGDSILGFKAHMGAGAITSNVRSDKKNVILHLPDEDIDTKRMKVGAFLGDRSEIGCNSVLNPGTVIGHDAIVYPLSSVRGYVHPSSIYKGFRNIIERVY